MSISADEHGRAQLAVPGCGKFYVDWVVQVSTCHITDYDSEILKAHADENRSDHPQVIMSYYHGFMVSAWHNGKDNPEKFYEKLKQLGHSEGYILLVSLAHKAGAKWLNLDCDADDYDFLPEYEW